MHCTTGTACVEGAKIRYLMGNVEWLRRIAPLMVTTPCRTAISYVPTNVTVSACLRRMVMCSVDSDFMLVVVGVHVQRVQDRLAGRSPGGSPLPSDRAPSTSVSYSMSDSALGTSGADLDSDATFDGSAAKGTVPELLKICADLELYSRAF